jgi:hypothetical protein
LLCTTIHEDNKDEETIIYKCSKLHYGPVLNAAVTSHFFHVNSLSWFETLEPLGVLTNWPTFLKLTGIYIKQNGHSACQVKPTEKATSTHSIKEILAAYLHERI